MTTAMLCTLMMEVEAGNCFIAGKQMQTPALGKKVDLVMVKCSVNILVNVMHVTFPL